MDTNMSGGMPEKKGNGATIGVIVIIIVLLAGAWYMWRGRTANTTDEPAIENEVGDLDADEANEAALNSQSESDEVVDIEADAKATDVDSI